MNQRPDAQTEEGLATSLADTLIRAPSGEKTNAYFLFGIKYGDHLQGYATLERIVEICRREWPEAGASRTSHADIRMGVKLAPYVEFRDGEPPNWVA